MHDSVLVLVCNNKYLLFAKKLFRNALAEGKWNGDLLLITNDETIRPFSVGARDVSVKYVKPFEEDFSWSIYNPIVLNKLNLFEEDMKKWKQIVFLDCDITIQGDINSLARVNTFSAVPYRAYKLMMFFLNKDSAVYKDLLSNFDLNLNDSPLNSGVMAFPSRIVSRNTFNDMVVLYNKYKHIMHSDDDVINLYFYNKWAHLPITYNFDYENYRGFLSKKIPPRVIHYIHSKEWQDESCFEYGAPTRVQDFIYELISMYLAVRSQLRFDFTKIVHSFLNKSKYVFRIIKELEDFKFIHRFPTGHYHSPIPDMRQIEEHYSREPGTISGIDFNFTDQRSMLDSLLLFYKEIYWNFSDDALNATFRYKKKEATYRYSDAVFLFLMMRKYKPSRIVEVGSGSSSAIMLDTNDLFFQDTRIFFTFIESNPNDCLNKLITKADQNNCRIYANKIQDVDPSIFKELQENDILFIDSSHVCKAASDLNFLFFEILPLLNQGVLVHFHNIFYPFEYPKDWLTEERFFWNECYLLRAFLMNNSDYRIVLFNSAAHRYHYDYLKENTPETLIDHEHCGGIWIQKK